MVELNVYRKSGHIVSYSTIGHANYGEHGKNIVCAGISALEDGMNCTLDHYGVEYKVNEYIGGMRTVHIEKPDDITDAILSVFMVGCKRIEEAYPQCIKIKEL